MRFKITLFICAFSLFFVNYIWANVTDAIRESVVAPILFEPNHGQASPDVKYLARDRYHRLLLTSHGAVVESSNRHSVLNISLEGSRPNSELKAQEAAGVTVNYFRGNDPSKWQTSVPTYFGAIYKDVYPGIDWEFYHRDGLLEFDFIVGAGADPTQIRMNLAGANRIEIDKGGNLIVTTEKDEIRILAPEVYQCEDHSIDCHSNRTEVKAEYRIVEENKVQLELASYNAEKTLIIDPKIAFGTLLGSNEYDIANDVAADTKGNFYVAGFRLEDGFMQKFNSSGALIWTTILGGSGFDSADAIAVTPAGICYIAGDTTSGNFPIVGGFQTRNAGGTDGYIVKLAANGSTIIRSSFLGGNGNDDVTGIQLGTGSKLGGAVYIFGDTGSKNFPRINASQNNYGGGQQDGFLSIVHSTNFQLLMSTYLGKKGDDQISSLELNTARGDLYAGGFSTGGLEDRFLAHLQPTTVGNIAAEVSTPIVRYGVKWAKIELIYDVIYIGYRYGPVILRKTSTTNLKANASAGSFMAIAISGACVPQPPSTTCNDIGLLVFVDQDLNLQRTVNFGGLTGLYINDMAISRNGTIHVAGETLSDALPKVNAFQTTNKGGWEGWVMSFAPGTQQITMSSYLGGAGSDFIRAIATDNAGNIFVAGQTSSKQFPTTPNAQKKTVTGTADGFVVKITP